MQIESAKKDKKNSLTLTELTIWSHVFTVVNALANIN